MIDAQYLIAERRTQHERERESEREYSQLGVVLFLLNIFVLFFFFFPRHPIVALKDSGDYNAQKFNKKKHKKKKFRHEKKRGFVDPVSEISTEYGGGCVCACVP